MGGRVFTHVCDVTDKARVYELAKTAAAVIAEAIVESALKKGRYSPKRPITVNLIRRSRLLPDSLFQMLVAIMGITGSMKCWVGREKK